MEIPQNEIKIVKVSTLKNWDKNPREIEDDKFELLKKYVIKHGVSVLKVDSRDSITVLGGNMRLKALVDLEVEEVRIEIMPISSDSEAVEVALLDNMQFGQYVRASLVELAKNTPDLVLEDFQIELAPSSLVDLVNLPDSALKSNTGDEANLKDYLKTQEKTALIKITTTKENADIIQSVIDEANKKAEYEDDGEALVSRLIRNEK